jgi:hypothetical protein
MSASTFKGAITTQPKPIVHSVPFSSNDVDLKRSVSIRCTVAYPSLVELGTLDNKHSVLAIVDSNDPKLKLLHDLILDCVQAASGKRTFPAGWHNPIRDGDEVKPNGGYVFQHEAFRGNKTVLRAKTQFAPRPIWGAKKAPCDPGEIEGGDECIVAFGAYYFSKGAQGIGLSLNGIWLIKKGVTKIERGGSANFSDFDTSGIEFMDEASVEASA